jgi:hypothetical protein
MQVAPDHDGGILIVATFTGTVRFADATFTSVGAGDLLVARFDAARALSWIKHFGGIGDEVCRFIAVDHAGDLVVVGHTAGGFDLGTGILNTGGAQSRFVAKLRNADGTGVFALVTPNGPAATPEEDVWNTVAVDKVGNVLVSGRVFSFVDVGTVRIPSFGDSDVYIIKVSPAGALLWARRWGSYGSEASHGVATDPQGNVFVLASFDRELALGGETFMSRGSFDAVLAKLNPDGEHIWSRQFGGDNYDLPGRLAVDPGGNALIVGHFWGATAIGTTLLATRGEWDAFAAKIGADGDVLWTRQIGGTATEHAWGAATDGAGNLLVSGFFQGEVDFGEGPRRSHGDKDAFVVKYDSEGRHLWSQRFGGAGWDTSGFLATGPDLHVYTAGGFVPPVDFGGGTALLGMVFALELAP